MLSTLAAHLKIKWEAFKSDWCPRTTTRDSETTGLRWGPGYWLFLTSCPGNSTVHLGLIISDLCRGLRNYWMFWLIDNVSVNYCCVTDNHKNPSIINLFYPCISEGDWAALMIPTWLAGHGFRPWIWLILGSCGSHSFGTSRLPGACSFHGNDRRKVSGNLGCLLRPRLSISHFHFFPCSTSQVSHRAKPNINRSTI